jgi:NADPH:quinone reductase-like Zn-dependent oxidoreductase
VRVRAASVSPLDWHFMRSMPYVVRLMAGLARPNAGARKLGADMAGSVEAVGKHVTSFKPGDEVSGGLEERGALAESIAIRADGAVLTKPASLTFEHAARAGGTQESARRR